MEEGVSSTESTVLTRTSPNDIPPGGSTDEDARKQREFRDAIEAMFKEAAIDSLSSSDSEEVNSDASSDDLPPPPPLSTYISSEDEVEQPCSLDLRDSSSILAADVSSKPFSLLIAGGARFPAPPYVSSESDVEAPPGDDFQDSPQILEASAKARPYSVVIGWRQDSHPADMFLPSSHTNSDSELPDVSDILKSHVPANPFSVPVSSLKQFPEVHDRSGKELPGATPSMHHLAMFQTIPIAVQLSLSESDGDDDDGCHSDDVLPDAADILDAEMCENAVTMAMGSDDELPPPPPPNDYSSSDTGDESATNVIDFYNRLGLPEDLMSVTCVPRLTDAHYMSSSSCEDDGVMADDDRDVLEVLETL